MYRTGIEVGFWASGTQLIPQDGEEQRDAFEPWCNFAGHCWITLILEKNKNNRDNISNQVEIRERQQEDLTTQEIKLNSYYSELDHSLGNLGWSLGAQQVSREPF